jgi:ABC-2 type transport system ATP-binding protein
VKKGEVFGLLGPNGAGKTTLLRLLLGYLTPTSGSATIDDLDCHHQSLQVRQRVAYLPGDARLFRQMRGRTVLQFFSEIRAGSDKELSRQLAERLELDLSRRVAYMSTGMRQKLALSAVMAANTPLLILDEPTANLDPTVRGEVMQMVIEARDRGRTVMFSSHILSEIEEVCDRVVFLRSGKLVRTQVMSELRRRHRIRAALHGPMPKIPESLAGELTVREEAENHVTIDTPGELSPLLGWLAKLPIDHVNVEPIGLRAIYDEIHHSRNGESV